MLLELTEMLRCPHAHEEAYVVCVPIAAEGRDVRRGVVGCPVCQAEFQVTDGVLVLDDSRRVGQSVSESAFTYPLTDLPTYDSEALEAFLHLEGRGGYVVLAGSAARHAGALAARLDGIHVVAVNPPPGTVTTGAVSVVLAPQGLPLKTQSMRAVALGRDHAGPHWLDEAVRVLLPGLRLVVERETAEPAGATVLARGGGVLVAEKRSR